MIKIIKYLLLIIVFLESLVLFLPKENIYYYILNELKKEKVLVVNKNIKDRYFNLNLSNTTIFYNDINAMNIKNINSKTYIFVSTLNIINLNIDDSLKQFLPSKIKSIQISHSILNPLKVNIKANLIGAKAYGVYDIQQNKIILNIKASKQFVRKYKKLFRNAKKQTNGEYKIEYKL